MIVAQPYSEVQERRTITLVGAILAEIVAVILIIVTSSGRRSRSGSTSSISAGYVAVGDLIYIALIVIAGIGVYATYTRNRKFAKYYLFGISGFTITVFAFDIIEGVLEGEGVGCSGCERRQVVLAIILAVITVACCSCCIITVYRFHKAFNSVAPSAMVVEMYGNPQYPQVVQPQPYSTQPYPPMYQGAGVATVGMPVPEGVANSFQPAYAQPMGQPMYYPQQNMYPQYPVQPPMQSMGDEPCA